MNSLRIFACCCLLGWLSAGPAQAVPGFEAVRSGWQASDARLLDRQGELLHSLRLDAQGRRLAWTPLDQVAPVLPRLLLYSEDRRFYEHGGVDWRALGAAAWSSLRSGPTRGASTLTMQLAGLLQDGGSRQGRRSLWEKGGQILDALALERSWNKAQILEAYLNLASFRGELQGVAAMSQGLFGKAPLGLDAWESALAVALLRAPEAGAAQVGRRACRLLQEQEPGSDCAGVQALAQRVLRPGYRPLAGGEALHLARRLLHQPGERLVSSLDGALQRFAAQRLHQQIHGLRQQNGTDGAVLVLDNASGEVLAWVGSSGIFSEAPQVDGVTALRQAGSTLKPLLFAQAIAQRRLTAASLLEDSPVRIATPGGLYVPQNYDRSFKGTVSLRMALGSSLNVPAVRALLQVGPEAFLAQLRDLGFDSLREDADHYGYSLALGGADVSLLMLTNAYRTLARGGLWSPLRYRPGEPGEALEEERQVLDPAASFVVADILADRSARIHTFGLDSLLATSYWSAVKTGTSKDMRDNWCIGFSRRYTVGVWVGNARGLPMQDVSGVSGAAPVWREVLDHLEKGQGGEPPPPPAGLVRQRVVFEPALEPPRQEWFLAGTERQRVVALNPGHPGRDAENLQGDGPARRIAYPGQGTVIALDPDIPLARQRIRLRSEPAGSARWRLNGREVGELWLPQPGAHRLELLDGSGAVVDQVAFQVRGISFKPAPAAGRP